jgi:DNA-binding CsgD family transcriptional regulator
MDLVGRFAEMLRAERILTKTAAAESRSIAVVGPAGIGKTALLAAIVDVAKSYDPPFTVVRVTGEIEEQPLAYERVRQVLFSLDEIAEIDAIPNDHQAEPDEQILNTLRITSGTGDKTNTHLDPTPIDSVAGALVRRFSKAAELRPLLVIVDDLQWVDESSARALELAAARLLADRVSIVFGIRTSQNTQDGQHAQDGQHGQHGQDGQHGPGKHGSYDVELSPRIEVINLRPLSDSESAAFLAGSSIPYDEIPHVVQSAAGVPLSLVELAQKFDNSTAAGIAATAALDRSRGEVMDVRKLYQNRIAKLSASTRTFCCAASFDPDLSVLNELFTDLNAELVAAEAANLLTLNRGRVEFVHPVMRECAAVAVGPSQQRAMHGALAKYYSDARHLDPDRYALHAAHAAVGTDETAANALFESAARATSRGSIEEPINLLHWAIRLTSEREKRDRWMMQIGYLHLQNGDVPKSIAICEQLQTSGANLGYELDHLAADASKWDRAPSRIVDYFRTEATRIETTDPGRHALMLAELAGMSYLYGDITAGIADADKAIAVADLHGHFFAGISARGALLWNLSLANDDSRDGELTDVLAALRSFAAQPTLDGLSICLLISMMDLMHERWDQSEGLLMTAAPKRLGDRLSVLLMDCVMSAIAWRRGRWHEALPLITQHFDGGMIPAVSLAWMRAAAAGVTASLGDEAETRRLTNLALHTANELRLPLVSIWANGALGLFELGEGRPEVALTHLDSVANDARKMGLRIPGFLLWRGDWIDALIETGRLAEAEVATSELAAFPSTCWNRGVVARSLAQRSKNLDEAITLSADAVQEFSTVGMPFEIARTRFALGKKMISSMSNTESARPELTEALRIFHRLGASGWAKRVTAVLDAISSANRAHAGSVGDEADAVIASAAAPGPQIRLSPAENRVALLVAMGKTSREVAEALYVSEKTVGFHLRSIYMKYGVSRRVEFVNAFRASENAA